MHSGTAGLHATRSRKLGRALALVVLLLGPLTLGEVWARGQLELLYPFIMVRYFWSDTKMMLLERAGCPQVLALGSSITNRTLVDELVVGRKLPFPSGDQPVESVFSFGLNKARTTHLYAAWRHINASGCTPSYVFVEVTPATLNADRSNLVLLTPFLDAITTWKLPRGFASEAGIGWLAIVEAATWSRLTLHRLRHPIASALQVEAGLLALTGPDLPPPRDGMIRPLSLRELDRRKFADERAERHRLARLGAYTVRASEVQTQALIQLVAAAQAAGSRVVLHSPPVTSIYHEIVDRTGGHETFCRTREELAGRPGFEWYWAYDGEGYAPTDFMDWNHMNITGGRRYVRHLFHAVRDGWVQDDAWCREVRTSGLERNRSGPSYRATVP